VGGGVGGGGRWGVGGRVRWVGGRGEGEEGRREGEDKGGLLWWGVSVASTSVPPFVVTYFTISKGPY